RFAEDIYGADQHEGAALDGAQVTDKPVDDLQVVLGGAVGDPFLGRSTGANDKVELPVLDLVDVRRAVKCGKRRLLEQRASDEAGVFRPGVFHSNPTCFPNSSAVRLSVTS